MGLPERRSSEPLLEAPLLITQALRESRLLPTLILAIWLIFVGTGLWQHIKVAETPPNYDPLSYIEKAKNFWEQVRAGNIGTAFTVEPTVRPVGTILMSYPMGFARDLRGFYFRSVFVPVVLLVAAAYVIGYRRDMSVDDCWRLTFICIFLSTLPAFYHFEFGVLPSPVCWGLVDNFMAGIAASSLAAALRSAREDARTWLAISSLLAGLALFVKPVGLFVMALVGLCWLIGVAFRLSLPRNIPGFGRNASKSVAMSAGMMFGIFFVFWWSAVATGYFSDETLSFGRLAIAVMREVLAMPLAYLPTLINTSFGIVQVLVVLLICILGAVYSFRTRPAHDSQADLLVEASFVSALLCIATGLWLWLFALGGGTQIRYFFPFGFMALTGLVPVADIIVGKLPRACRIALAFVVAVLATNLAALIVYSESSIAWQYRSGVNLLSNGYKAETDQAKQLLAEVGVRDRRAFLYVFMSSIGAQVIDNYAHYSRLANLTSAVLLETRHTYDWVSGFVVRTADLVDSDYIVFEPVPYLGQRTKLFSPQGESEFDQEEKLFRAWLSEATEQNGVRTVSETSVRIIRVEDRIKFDASLRNMVQQRKWRPFFVESNREPWWGVADLADYMATHPLLARGTHFADLFLLHGVELDRNGNQLTVTIWWERLKEDPNPWLFFIHEIDHDHKIVARHAISIEHPSPLRSDKPIRRDAMTIELTGRRVKGLAVGFYRRALGPLMADRGDRDWDDRRLLLSLPARIPTAGRGG